MKPTNNAKDGDKGDCNAFNPKAKSPGNIFFLSDKLLWLEAVLEDIWLKWRVISTCRDHPHMPCLSLPCQLRCCCWYWMPPCQWRWWCEHRVIMLTPTLVAFKMIPSFSSSTVSATKPTTPITSCANHWISQSPCWSSGVQRLLFTFYMHPITQSCVLFRFYLFPGFWSSINSVCWLSEIW